MVQLLKTRLRSLERRARALRELRSITPLPSNADLTTEQWRAIEEFLDDLASGIIGQVEPAARNFRGQELTDRIAIAFNEVLCAAEHDLTLAYDVFDLLMDILTQRMSPSLGPLLKGCDVLAADALDRDHPALRGLRRPVVAADRGFGASIVRQGALLEAGIRSPLPVIQIPYSRLVQENKCSLVSVLHECGHEAMVRTGLVSALPVAMRAKLASRGAPKEIQDFYALWSSEIGPDFWGFCCAGAAQPGSLRDIFCLPAEEIFAVRVGGVHPPPHLRFALGIDFAKWAWGTEGPWIAWEEEWNRVYPLDPNVSWSHAITREALRYLSDITAVLFTTRFRALQGRALPALFSLEELRPAALERRPPLRPCVQLAAFRARRDAGEDPTLVETAMTRWLGNLGATFPNRLLERSHGNQMLTNVHGSTSKAPTTTTQTQRRTRSQNSYGEDRGAPE